MSPSRTLYDILGVAANASSDEISAAFESRQAELQSQGDPAHALMALREAHRILGNPERRSKYDASLATRIPKVAPPPPAEPSRSSSKVLAGVAVVAVVAGFIGWKLKPDSLPDPAPAPPRVAASAPTPPTPAEEPSATEQKEVPQATAPPEPPAPVPVTPAGPPLPPAELYGLYWPSVVRVTTSDAAGRFIGQGSGVVTERNGAVTPCHVVKDAHKIMVGDAGTDRPAVVSLADEELDLCKLRVPSLAGRVPNHGSLANVRTGQRVYAIGAAWQTERALAEGIINSLHDAGKGVVIQVSIPVPPSWDGGALFSMDGQLIGILTTRHQLGKDVNLAIPVDWIAKMEPRSAPISPAETPPAILSMLIGRWSCHDPLGKQSGEYDYGPDGILQLIWGRKGGVRVPYRVEGMSIRYTARGEQMTLQIESVSANRMVQYFNSGARLTCERTR